MSASEDYCFGVHEENLWIIAAVVEFALLLQDTSDDSLDLLAERVGKFGDALIDDFFLKSNPAGTVLLQDAPLIVAKAA